MAQGPVSFQATNFGGHDIEVRRMWYTGTTTLTRGAVMYYATAAALTSFTKGPGIDVTLCPSSPVAALFAGILCDDSVDVTDPGWVNVQIVRPGDVCWCKVAAALDFGDGVLLQQATSAATQGFSDSGAYAAGDLGICIGPDEDAATAPYTNDNLALIKFGVAV